MFVDCRCEDACPILSDGMLSEKIGWMTVDSLCLDESEADQLMERVMTERLTDIVISGCDGSPIPGRLKDSLGELGCSFSGLNMNSERLCADSADIEVSEFAHRLSLARAAQPWSDLSMGRAQLPLLRETGLSVKYVSSASGRLPWGLRLKGNEVWLHSRPTNEGEFPVTMVD